MIGSYGGKNPDARELVRLDLAPFQAVRCEKFADHFGPVHPVLRAKDIKQPLFGNTARRAW